MVKDRLNVNVLLNSIIQTVLNVEKKTLNRSFVDFRNALQMFIMYMLQQHVKCYANKELELELVESGVIMPFKQAKHQSPSQSCRSLHSPYMYGECKERQLCEGDWLNTYSYAGSYRMSVMSSHKCKMAYNTSYYVAIVLTYFL